MSDNLFSNWVIENSATVGNGPIILSGALGVNQARFRDAVNAGNVYYSLTSGANRECGTGVFNGTNQITRTDVKATLVDGTYNDNNPSPINLEGEVVVSCTLNADLMHQVIADLAALQVQVDANTSNIEQLDVDTANLDLRVSQNESDIASNTATIDVNALDIATNTGAIAVIDDDLSYREVSITALEQGGLITQNGTTAILVAAGNGEIINSYDDPENQDTEEISWLEQTFDLLTNGGMPVTVGVGLTIIGIQSDGNGTGTVMAFPNGVTASQRRITIVLGIVEYIDQSITSVDFTPVISNQIGNVMMDLIDYIDAEAKLRGLVLRPTEIGDLTVWRDSGEVFIVGGNYENSRSNQNVRQVAAAGAIDTSIPFYLTAFNNGTTGVGALVSLVPSDAYEENGAGTITPLPNNNATIHYMVESLSGNRFMSYGQAAYADFPTALNNLFADKSSHLFPAEFASMVILAQIVVLKGAVAWTPDLAEIYPLGSATSSGSSGGSASQAVNISYNDTHNLGNNVQSALDTLAGLKLTPDQHAAVNAANAPTGANPFATQADVDAGGTGLSDHLADPTDAHDASAISNSPAGSIAATDVQGAIDELDSDNVATAGTLVDHIDAAKVDAHKATSISVVPTTDQAETEVQAALASLATVKLDKTGFYGSNWMVNGDFAVWQRGNTQNIAGFGFGADLWMTNSPGGRQTLVASGGSSSGIACRLSDNAVAAKIMLHAIELNKGGLSSQFPVGSKLTVSLQARSSVALSDANIQLSFRDDYDGNNVWFPDSGIVGNLVNANQWYDVEYTTTIDAGPAGSNNTLVTALKGHNADMAAVYDFRHVRLEISEKATPYEPIPKGVTLAGCLRYCAVFQQYTQIAFGNTGPDDAAVVLPRSVPFSKTPIIEQETDHSVYAGGQVRLATFSNFTQSGDQLKANMVGVGIVASNACTVRNGAGDFILSVY